MLKEPKSRKDKTKCCGISKWVVGYLVAGAISASSFYMLGISANHTTMLYVNNGYNEETGEWNPPAPLPDTLLPDPEWLEPYIDWITKKDGRGFDYTIYRDLPFGILITVGLVLPLLFGRLDVFMNTAMIQFFLIGIKFYINFTVQLPPSAGTRLNIHEIGGMDKVKEWREASKGGSKFWIQMLGGSVAHTGDMLYSGHTFNALNMIRAAMWVLSEAKMPYRKLIFWSYTLLSLALAVFGIVVMQLARGHYSMDITIAFLVWYFLTQWEWLKRVARSLANYFTMDGENGPPTIENCFNQPKDKEYQSLRVCNRTCHNGEPRRDVDVLSV